MASASGSDREAEPLLKKVSSLPQSFYEQEVDFSGKTKPTKDNKGKRRRGSAPSTNKALDDKKGSVADDRRTTVNVTQGATAVRKPVHYYSINPTDEHRLPEHNDTSHDTAMTLNRYKYYNRLAPHHENPLVMPDHVVPSYFFMILPVTTPGQKQGSFVTIFSIWNTMMGTSLLSMPWAIQEAGFGLGIGLILFMAAIAFYMAYLISGSAKRAGMEDPLVEFYMVCRMYLGKWGERVAIVFSLISLIGGAVVYWVLMSNFLFNVVVYIHDRIVGTIVVESSNDTFPGAFCPSMPIDVISNSTSWPDYNFEEFFYSSNVTDNPTMRPGPAPVQTTLFQEIWHVTHTVPFFLLLILGPLICIKSPTFFTKFNTLGTVSVAYLICFVSYKAYEWGIHIDFDATDVINMIPMYRWSFISLTGTCSLALFIHNCLLTILGMQKHPENNGRDLFCAYVLVTITYLTVGVVFYISFPFAKSCIASNLLNNIQNSDVLAFVARMFLLFQMTTVFPLLVYLFRAQFLDAVLGITDPTMKSILFVNLGVVAVCILFAVFLPNIGIIIRFTGALCGLAYIFALPCIIYMLQLRDADRLSWHLLIIHSIIILMGVANFLGQFVTL